MAVPQSGALRPLCVVGGARCLVGWAFCNGMGGMAFLHRREGTAAFGCPKQCPTLPRRTAGRLSVAFFNGGEAIKWVARCIKAWVKQEPVGRIKSIKPDW